MVYIFLDKYSATPAADPRQRNSTAGRAVISLLVPALLAMVLHSPPTLAAGDTDAAPRRILWIDSYDKGYGWSDGIGQGIRNALKDSGVELLVHHMQTKELPGEDELRQAGQRAMDVIERSKPDVVIASDDNAQQYLVVPYLRGGDLPVVFCGVNDDAQKYGYPAKNVTGMLEVEPLEVLQWHLHHFAGGDRVGYISGDVPTDRKVVEKYNRLYFDGALKPFLVSDFEDFKQQYLRAQEEVDMLLFMNNGGILGWSDPEAREFVLANTRIPTGTVAPYLKRFCLVTLGKDPQEQGEFAARTALRLLHGESAGDIPITRNERVLLTLNLDLAAAIGVLFPLSTLEAAEEILNEAGP